MSKLTPERLLSDLRKKFGEDSALLMGAGGGSGVREVCPTGNPVLDRWVIGVGGMPYGRIMEMFGAENSGKTTLMNRMLAGVQRDGGIAVLCETEHKYDPTWAELHGVVLEQLVLLQPPHLEAATEQFEAIIDKAEGKRILIALDSVAATPCKKEVEEGVSGTPGIGEAARVWSRSLRILSSKINKHQVAIVLVNQVRTKIGVMYGDPTTTPSGNAIKHYASLRLAVNHGKGIDGHAGRYINVTMLKNQLAPPFRKAALRLDFAKGFNIRWEVLNHAKELGMVPAKCQSFKDAANALGWQDLLVEGGDNGTEEETGSGD
jgi:recombination protein RecA